MSRDRAHLAVQTAIAGERVDDAVRALVDGLAIAVGYAAKDLAQADEVINALAGDLKRRLRLYLDEVQAGRAQLGKGPLQ